MRMIWKKQLNAMIDGLGFFLSVSVFSDSNLLILCIFNTIPFDEYPTRPEGNYT